MTFFKQFIFGQMTRQLFFNMSHLVRKPVFRISDQVRHKPVCTATEDGLRLEISDLGSRRNVLSMFICVLNFVFAYAKRRFSHYVAHNMSRVVRKPDFCICENKDADQLRGNREADQRLCFRYMDSKIPLLPKSEISSL